jgi:hypothetical protein
MKITVFFPIADRAEAIAMSVFEGAAQFIFSTEAIDLNIGGSASTHCVSSGDVAQSVADAYLADSRAKVSSFTGRQVLQAYSQYNMIPN